jgi:hypothetical protein
MSSTQSASVETLVKATADKPTGVAAPIAIAAKPTMALTATLFFLLVTSGENFDGLHHFFTGRIKLA